MTLNQHQFLWLASAFEGGLVLIAYLLGTWLSIDPLEHLKPDLNALVLGLMGTLPLYGLFILTHRLDIFQDIRRFLVDKLGGLLAGCSGIGLLYLGLLAGVTEEILFRGLLQPWLEQNWGWLGGLIFSNMIFALLHWITPLYALLAGLCGVYLGLMLDIGPERNLLTPILVHALYDFLAFIAVAQMWRQQHGSPDRQA
jgi:membrane protease YdiL (CAAX protease family)